ncbi:biopolymer transport protein ExbD [Parvibaculum indicum]|uniref:ExbD/TolR family protein n=1 Tax=Parvibaculum indicum TaxID=562969 RepID=UPI001422FA18|nr:biopolymer transporter ExbD [Parvibaculum indicum]NIJ40854.1 biopolymer transport protein ExbD [Parvibaculum indicum]
MKLTRRRRLAETESVVPLINIVFLLLIFFMVAGELAAPTPFPLDPPKSSSDLASEKREAELFVSEDGKLSFNGADVTEETLADALGAIPPEQVRVAADGKAEARLIGRLLAGLREAGVKRAFLVTVKN